MGENLGDQGSSRCFLVLDTIGFLQRKIRTVFQLYQISVTVIFIKNYFLDVGIEKPQPAFFYSEGTVNNGQVIVKFSQGVDKGLAGLKSDESLFVSKAVGDEMQYRRPFSKVSR